MLRRGCEEAVPVDRFACFINEMKALPGEAHEHLGAALDEVRKALGPGIATVAEHQLAGLERQPVELPALAQGGQFQIAGALAHRIVAQMRTVAAALARRGDGGGIDDAQPQARTARRCRGRKLALAQRLQPLRRTGDPLQQRHIGEFGDPPGARQPGHRAQRMTAGPIDEDEPQQTARRADGAPPQQCLVGERRSRQRRLAAQQFDHSVPVGRIKLVRFHPELESHPKSLAYQLKLAPMGSSPGRLP